jgi:hypothetical protein
MDYETFSHNSITHIRTQVILVLYMFPLQRTGTQLVKHMSEDYTKDEELLGATAKDELWSGVEAFVFAENSNSLSIHL